MGSGSKRNWHLQLCGLALTLLGACSDSSQLPASARPDTTSATATSTGKAASQTAPAIGAPTSSAAASSAMTIEYDPDGPNKIDEKSLMGDKAACDQVMACCNGEKGPLALGCKLAIAQSKGDCAVIAPKVVKMAGELGKSTPTCK